MSAPKTREETTLIVKRIVQASREKIFRAWTDPNAMKKWWGPEGCTPSSAEVDLRVGGRYRISTCRSETEEEIFVNGEYYEIVSPERIVFTWNWEPPGMQIGETLVTVEFRERGEATEITLTHERFPDEKTRDLHGAGWNSTFNCLAKYFG